MNVGHALVLPCAVCSGEELDGPPYLWSDLLARRNALALRLEHLVPVLRVDWEKYRARQAGDLPVGPDLVGELLAMENFVGEDTTAMLAAAPAAGRVVLDAVVDQDAFNATYPQARTLRDCVPYPLTLQHVAVGRAAAELSRRGHDVEVYRGAGRRADLTVRRLAAGLEKNETAALLGVEKKHYYTWERGKPTSPGLLAELQAVDDFITTSAAQLEVTDVDGVSVVLMLDDQRQFERAYPQARTLRDGVPYPIRVHRVAAARRAHQLAGTRSRIAVSAD